MEQSEKDIEKVKYNKKLNDDLTKLGYNSESVGLKGQLLAEKLFAEQTRKDYLLGQAVQERQRVMICELQKALAEARQEALHSEEVEGLRKELKLHTQLGKYCQTCSCPEEGCSGIEAIAAFEKKRDGK